MRAGSPSQEEYLRNNPVDVPFSGAHYECVCEALKKVGLYDDNDYHYGSAWNFEEVPEDVLNFLKNLPESKEEPAWV